MLFDTLFGSPERGVALSAEIAHGIIAALDHENALERLDVVLGPGSPDLAGQCAAGVLRLEPPLYRGRRLGGRKGAHRRDRGTPLLLGLIVCAGRVRRGLCAPFQPRLGQGREMLQRVRARLRPTEVGSHRRALRCRPALCVLLAGLGPLPGHHRGCCPCCAALGPPAPLPSRHRGGALTGHGPASAPRPERTAASSRPPS